MITYNRAIKRQKADQYLRYHASLLKAGEAMPALRQLMQASGIGRPILESTLQTLIAENILEVRDRSGYYRTDHPFGEKNSDNIVDIFACSVIGYLDPPNTYPQKFLNSLVMAGSDRHYSCRVHRVNISDPLTIYAEMIRQHNIKTAILYSPHSEEICKCFEHACVRWTCANPRFAPYRGPAICESENSVTLQMQYLYDHGHRKIGFIDEYDLDLPTWFFLARRERYYRFMAEHGLRVRPNYVFHQSFNQDEFNTALDRMFADAPTAVIVPCPMLVPFYQYCAANKIVIGKDISLTSFERHTEFSLTPEPVSMISNITEIAAMVFDQLMLTGAEERRKSIISPPGVLYPGKSVAQLNNI